MFEVYDLEMNKLEFPRGVKPLDIIVSSVGKVRSTSESDGRDGIIDYGYKNDTRMVDISLWIEARDTVDYRLVRNELFEFFTRHDKFYISEKHIPSRVMKVSVDSEIMLDRLTVFHAQVDLPCTVHGTPFWETKYDTLELHNSGYSAIVEKYGTIDNIDDTKTQHRFTTNEFTVYNAGTMTVHPEYMYLRITIGLLTTDGSFKLTNKTTGETFEWRKSVTNRNIYIRGMNVLEGSVLGFRHTNRRFISLVPGNNEFEVTGGTFSNITINFRYYYR